jgi:hypothetical protein
MFSPKINEIANSPLETAGAMTLIFQEKVGGPRAGGGTPVAAAMCAAGIVFKTWPNGWTGWVKHF